MVTFSTEGKQALDNFIEETARSGNVPGFVVGISGVDDELYFKGGGHHTIHDPKSGAIGPDSVLWLCSQTKLIASLAALILIERGKLSEDTPASQYFPELLNPIIVNSTTISKDPKKVEFSPAKGPILVKHLLNQSSGMFYARINDLDLTREGVPMPKEYVGEEMHLTEGPASAFLKGIKGDLPGFPILFEPGTDFVYGWSCDVLGFIVEKASGQTLEEFCKANIFQPLNMDTCSFLLTPELKTRLVDLAFRNADGSLTPWANQLDIPERDPQKVRLFCGGVGMYGSLRDYLKLLRHIMQIKARHPVRNPILKPETVQSLSIPTLTEQGSKSLSEFAMTPGVQWGNAMAIYTQQTRRMENGTLYWGGWAGTHHFIDFKSGISVVVGTQVAPNGDMPWTQTVMKLEGLIYDGLESKQ